MPRPTSTSELLESEIRPPEILSTVQKYSQMALTFIKPLAVNHTLPKGREEDPKEHCVNQTSSSAMMKPSTRRQRIKGRRRLAQFPRLIFLALLICCSRHVDGSLPLYYARNSVGRIATRQLGIRCRLNSNSLYRCRTQPTNAIATPFTKLHILPFLWDFLEPFENAWEFYVNRDDILEELLTQSAQFAKRHSVRFIAVTLGTYLTLDLASRLVWRKGIVAAIQSSEEAHDTLEEKIFQKIARDSAQVGLSLLYNFRRFGGKSKFAVALSSGALFYDIAIQLTTTIVKLSIGSFIVLEVMSFAGVIGEPGESIVDWIEDHRADESSWNNRLKTAKCFVKEHVSLEKLDDFYAVAVDEEKVACMGFAIGSILAMF